MAELSSLTDAGLVQRCRAGDDEAWNALVERFSRYVYAICIKGFRLSDEDDPAIRISSGLSCRIRFAARSTNSR